MSPSERRAAKVGDVGESDASASSTDHVSALQSALDSAFDSSSAGDEVHRPARGRSGAPGTSVRPSAPVDIPEIVPATLDVPSEPEPEPAPRPAARVVVVEQDPVPQQRTVTTSRHDAIDAWQRAASAPVVVPVPVGGGRVAAMRSVGRRPRVRKVTRVVRHIDPWSTFKVALIFSIVLYGVLLTAGVLLWNVASNTGTVDNVERWFTQFGWESYELKGGEIFHNAWIAGLFGAVGLTGMAVLAATLFNLISDMVGGVRVTVLEEEVIERTTSRSERFVVRRPPDGPPPAPEFDLEGDLDVPSNGPTARPSASRVTGPSTPPAG
ncbi:MAG: DUF3566 domain-containing protein [Candidatus Limnocylindrales bacterium]